MPTGYVIMANPVSGKLSPDQKRARLRPVADILNAEIHGLDTSSAEAFCICARELARTDNVLVMAGGDGTFSQILNTIDTRKTTLAYLPMGSGNALRHALAIEKRLFDAALRIKNGPIRYLDLIDCNDSKKAFMASIGFEGAILKMRDRYVAQGASGFKAYFNAVIHAYIKNRTSARATIQIDGKRYKINKMLSILVVKQPYYGYGMKVVPRARFDDRRLHILVMPSEFSKTLTACLTSFTVGNRMGWYVTGQTVQIQTDKKLWLQVDGDNARQAYSFSFKVLPEALQIKG